MQKAKNPYMNRKPNHSENGEDKTCEMKFEQANLYKQARQANYQNQNIVAELPRMYKYTLGEKLSGTILSIIVGIGMTYQEHDLEKKLKNVDALCSYLIRFLALNRTIFDLNIIAKNHYADQIKLVMQMSEAAFNWKNKIERDLRDEYPKDEGREDKKTNIEN